MKYHFIVLGLFFTCQVVAQDTLRLSLERAIQQAIEKNFSVIIAQKESKIAENNTTKGNAGMLPRIDATTQYSGSLNNLSQTFFDGRQLAVNNAFNRNFNAGIEMNWTIFDGKAMFIEYDRLKLMRQQGLDNVRANIENTVANVSMAYYNIIRQEAQVRLLKKNLQLSALRQQLAKDRYEVGTGSKLDYLAAQSDYQADSSLLVRQQQQYQEAVIDLNELLVNDIMQPIQTTDSIQLNASTTKEELKNKVKQSNVLLIQARNRQEQSYLQEKLLQSQRYPTITLNSGIVYANDNLQAGFIQQRTTTIADIGVRANLNLYNGNNLNRQRQNATISTQIAVEQLEALRWELEAKVERHFRAYQNSLIRIELEKRNVKIAVQTVEIALERYKIGVSTPLELREAQRNAVAAEIRLTEAYYEAKINEIELNRIAGNISAE
jgi:outer membrane protein TolC